MFICTLLLHMMAASIAGATTQASQPAFDYDRALAFSQAAIGVSVGNHRFTDIDGRAVTLDSFRGKPLVIGMIYTSCYQVCPMTTRHLATVVQKARDALGDDSFAIALVGFDSAVDTPPAMRYFAGQQGIDGSGWHLLSGTRDNVEALSADLGFQYFPSSNGFDHLIQASIIDAEGRVYRQVYGQVFETPLLVDPLIELVLGRAAPKRSLLENLGARIKLFCTTYDPARDGYYFDYSLFLGMLIGASIILVTTGFALRELRKR
ncbi:MAG: SCO family protein [Gammaproteobacteria bacterium]|nr:SCO family protein [Gammaproteobacteria bacterium]